MTLAITSIVVIAFVLPLCFLVRTIATDRATNRASSDAQNLGQAIAANRPLAAQLVAEADAASPGRISVYFPDGTVIGDRSDPPSADSLALARRGRAFSRAAGGGLDVFVPVLERAQPATVVRDHVSGGVLHHGVAEAWLALATLAIVLVAIAGAVADRMARSVTDPIRRLTEMARRLAAGDLDARAEVEGSSEVVEVSRALDTLAARIGELLQAEREHAADLSHSLRTPLTALRLDAEQLGDEAEARRITAAVDELEDAVTRVIADTRRERPVAPPRGIDLGAVVAERTAFWEVLARAQRRQLTVALDPAEIIADARRDDVRQLVDVLLDNVLRHTPAGTPARVSTKASGDGGGRLVVEDAGPGLRGRAARRSRGSGLGLEIARRIARDAHGSLSIGRSELGGLRVEVVLGPAPPAGG